MTEEILKSAILQLKAQATGRFAIIKDLYHRPATEQTVDQIVQQAIALAQLEGAMITLQQYSTALSMQTVDEKNSNQPEEPTEVEVEEVAEKTESEERPSPDELSKRSATYRKSMKKKKLLKKSKEDKKNES